MDALHTLAILLPLALTSGINLYATVLVVGLSIRFHWVTDAPANLDVLSAWPIIVLAALLYIVEFVADKIQIVDNIWDIIHTFIRPVGGALIGLAAVGDADPVLGILGALVGGGIALATHGGKSSARLALNVVSPAENVSNIFVSAAEDVAAGGLAFLALKYPYVAGGIAILLLLLILIFTPLLLRWLFFLLRAVAARFNSLGQREVLSDLLPAEHMVLLYHQPPELSVRGKAQGIPGAGGRNGFVLLWREYRRGNRAALDTLVRYNLEDVVNLKYLADLVYNKASSALPIEVETLPPPVKFELDLPYDEDLVDYLGRAIQEGRMR